MFQLIFQFWRRRRKTESVQYLSFISRLFVWGLTISRAWDREDVWLAWKFAQTFCQISFSIFISFQFIFVCPKILSNILSNMIFNFHFVSVCICLPGSCLKHFVKHDFNFHFISVYICLPKNSLKHFVKHHFYFHFISVYICSSENSLKLFVKGEKQFSFIFSQLQIKLNFSSATSKSHSELF